MTIKEKIETIQSLVTIGAVLVGGFWTYTLFIKERENYPHATIEHAISHIALSRDTNLLRVSMTAKNTSTSMLTIKNMLIRVQQIPPTRTCAEKQPCAADQVKKALREVERKEDRFSWRLISERTKDFDKPIEIEPSEQDQLDFEFAIPSNVTDVRIYSYIKNERKEEIGWFLSSYYKLDNAKREQ